jgi:two-component system chemotaxis response regulator CheB
MNTRVMLVDDAIVVRHILSDTLSKVEGIDVVGTAPDGVIALEKLPSLRPDVVVLDVEMPKMDGIETLAAIKQRHPGVKVIMFSTLTSRGASATMDALMQGADDYVTKPANVGSVAAAIDRINSELAPKIKALHGSRSGGMNPGAAPGPRAGLPGPPPAVPAAAAWRPATPRGTTPVTGHAGAPGAATPVPGAPAPSVARPFPNAAVPGLAPARPAIAVPRVGMRSGPTTKPQILTIAVSTGGPNALASLLPQLPGDLAVPIVIVQHIPPIFSKALADRLDAKCALSVSECVPGATIAPGQVWIAPGDFHMTLRRDGTNVKLETNQGPPENSCRPAADVLFRSVASVYGPATLGLVLTGMGSDGLKGAIQIVEAGGRIIAQDEATSVVWGMPGAVHGAGVVDSTLPLQQIAGEILARVGTRKVSPTVA